MEKWPEVIITAEGTSVRCRIWNKYFDEVWFPYQEKPGLAKPEGILLKTNKNKTEDSKRKNYELLKEHEEGKLERKGYNRPEPLVYAPAVAYILKFFQPYVNACNSQSQRQLKHFRAY